jgi:hypothetical protein
MAVATTRVPTHRCPACREPVDDDAVYCPDCGAHQPEDRLTAVTSMPGETDRLARSANALILTALGVMAALLLAVGILAGRLSANGTGGSGDGAEGSAAEAMDAYAPYAETWTEKHGHLTDEASGDDPNGLATAAADARLWIGANRGDLGALAAAAEGASARLYDELVGIFDERTAVLGSIETTATAGGNGEGAAADEVAALEQLDQRADAVTCEIADVMRAEGDDPDDHITSAMGVTC